MRVALIRHGLTALGEAGRYQGRIDEPLSDRGREELLPGPSPEIGQVEENSAGQCTPWPEIVYTSPAKRARETASILFPEAEQTAVEALWEMNFGVFDGRGWWEMKNDPRYRAWVDGGCEGRCPEGENLAEYRERVCNALRMIFDRACREGSRGIVIVAHGGTQMAALSSWGDASHTYWQWQTACGCGWLLDWDGSHLQVRSELRFVR
ncbi:MAG: histidine phosphatase family protein [Oscillospiraceae bacterium]|nr:histidine phosphatase family protein [Oscillospiraceae bacterium]